MQALSRYNITETLVSETKVQSTPFAALIDLAEA